MFVFAFEGELLAFIVNGDRFVLLALLPRRNPRTDRTVQPPCHSVIELNLTSSRLLRFACTVWRLAWIFVSSVRCHTSTPCGQNAAWGLPDKKNRGHPAIGMTSVSEFSPSDRLAAVLPLPLVGAAPMARVFVFGPRYRSGGFTFSFSVGSLASFVTGVSVNESCNRCRSR